MASPSTLVVQLQTDFLLLKGSWRDSMVFPLLLIHTYLCLCRRRHEVVWSGGGSGHSQQRRRRRSPPLSSPQPETTATRPILQNSWQLLSITLEARSGSGGGGRMLGATAATKTGIRKKGRRAAKWLLLRVKLAPKVSSLGWGQRGKEQSSVHNFISHASAAAIFYAVLQGMAFVVSALTAATPSSAIPLYLSTFLFLSSSAAALLSLSIPLLRVKALKKASTSSSSSSVFWTRGKKTFCIA